MKVNRIRSTRLMIVVVFAFVVQGCSQHLTDSKTYEAENYRIKYPSEWLVSNDSGIVNIYPKDDLGAITISFHSGITFPLEKTKQLILEMNQIADTPDHVTMTDKGAFVEFTHEYLDKKSNVHWFAKAIRKNNDLYLVTVNCADEVWESKKSDYFTAVTSFEIKK